MTNLGVRFTLNSGYSCVASRCQLVLDLLLLQVTDYLSGLHSLGRQKVLPIPHILIFKPGSEECRLRFDEAFSQFFSVFPVR